MGIVSIAGLVAAMMITAALVGHLLGEAARPEPRPRVQIVVQSPPTCYELGAWVPVECGPLAWVP